MPSLPRKILNERIRKAEILFDKKKKRFTEMRRVIFTLIVEENRPIKAYDLLNSLIQKGYNASPMTVYRQLDFLQKMGLIHKLRSSSAYIGCAHPEHTGASSFLICKSCHAVDECPTFLNGPSFAQMKKNHRFHVDEATFEIAGLCHKCYVADTGANKR